MFTFLALGALTAAAVIILAHKLGIRKIAGHDKSADVLLSAGLMFVFAGTITGLITAAIAGIIVSLYLIAVKRNIQVEHLVFNGLRLPTWQPLQLT